MMFVRYVVTQLLAYCVDMGTFLISLSVSSPITANIFGKLAAGIFAFLMHRIITFRVNDQEGALSQAVRYFLLLALNVPLASAILAALLVFVNNLVVAKLLADGVCVVLTYSLSKHLIFVSKG